MDFDIVSFGSAVVDVFVNTDSYEKQKFMCYPIGGKILIKELRFDIGGGGTNTSAAFSRLGFKTGCICNVGKDENGDKILDCLKKERVEFLGKIDNNGMSGYSIVLDSRGGERTILTYKGVNDDISLNDIKKFNTKWLYFSSLLGKSFETQEKLAFHFVKKGVRLGFNPSMYLIKNYDLRKLISLCEVLILNKEEAHALLKKVKYKGKDILLGLHSLGSRIVVITDKDKEILCYDGIKKYSLNPNKNLRVVERTGAGDAFASGFVAGLMLNWKIEKCLEFGLRESENVIKYFGAKNNLLKIKLNR